MSNFAQLIFMMKIFTLLPQRLQDSIHPFIVNWNMSILATKFLSGLTSLNIKGQSNLIFRINWPIFRDVCWIKLDKFWNLIARVCLVLLYIYTIKIYLVTNFLSNAQAPLIFHFLHRFVWSSHSRGLSLTGNLRLYPLTWSYKLVVEPIFSSSLKKKYTNKMSKSRKPVVRDKNLKRSYSFFFSHRLSLDMCFTHLYVNKCTSKICIFIARFEGCGYSFVYLIYIYIYNLWGKMIFKGQWK